MKIAHIGLREIPTKQGGIEKHVEEISFRLKNNKIFGFVRMQKPNKKFKNIRLIKTFTLSNKYLETIVYSISSTIKACINNFDIIHFHALATAPFSFFPGILKKKIILTIHGLDWKRAKWNKFAKLYLKFCEICSVYFPNKIIVVSKTLQKYYLKKYNKKTIYIPNGISCIKINQKKIKKFGLKKNNYILYVGRLVPEKGIHYLIKAYKQIRTNKKLVIVGGSSYTDRYVKYLKSISNKNILFLGIIKENELYNLYFNSYLFVLPSEIEGLSISLLEAMSFGKCVLVSDISENKEAVENLGYYFKNKNIEDLKDKLNFLLKNSALVKQAGNLAKKHVLKNYNWDIIAQQTEKVYYDLLKNV